MSRLWRTNTRTDSRKVEQYSVWTESAIFLTTNVKQATTRTWGWSRWLQWIWWEQARLHWARRQSEKQEGFISLALFSSGKSESWRRTVLLLRTPLGKLTVEKVKVELSSLENWPRRASRRSVGKPLEEDAISPPGWDLSRIDFSIEIQCNSKLFSLSQDNFCMTVWKYNSAHDY